MSRVQSSFPLKSNPFKMPVPVITNTLLPSVTGEGDDIFCFLILVLPPPSSFFQSNSPFARLTNHKSSSSPSATFKNSRSFQITGVEPLQLGNASFQAMFSSGDHFHGKSFSLLMPFKFGPRHCGQFSARTIANTPTRRQVTAMRFSILTPP